MNQLDIFHISKAQVNQIQLSQGKCKICSKNLNIIFRPFYINFPFRKSDDYGTNPYPNLKKTLCQKPKTKIRKLSK